MVLQGGVSLSQSNNPTPGGDPILFRLDTEIGFNLVTSVLPQGFRIGKTANFNGEQVMNTSSPIQVFVASNATLLSLMLDLHQLSKDDPEVMDVVYTLMALVVPQDPGVQPVTLCTIQLGT